MDRLAELLAENYGLDRILIQNDIEESYVIKLLIIEGLVDPDDYLYEDEENSDD